jgi:hypothetical protein
MERPCSRGNVDVNYEESTGKYHDVILYQTERTILCALQDTTAANHARCNVEDCTNIQRGG